ncbi:MAG: ATP-dependent RNA helicase HrpA [Proteobacteria bacterium]|nr:ATP-dependent RNA helicase HrpA [Pseudomonadota bacterium]MBU1056872.1 ATP-dependent RNA helicase HrpA [Pseudomonadota bacterium]
MELHYPTELPIVSYRESFLELFKEHQIIIISGETGSGKTTQLPKFCLESSPDSTLLIGCTQPRRVAATSVASRVSEELKQHADLVGYKIRFQDKTSKTTRIKFMTDGVLLAETRQDPLLRRYGVIIIDEAHERSLNIDFLLGYLKKLLPRRPDLKVIITSATIDTKIFSRHFNNAPILNVEGRSFPVEIRYQPPTESEEKDDFSYVEHCVETIVQLHLREPSRDTLVFLPTEKDIRECCTLLEQRIPSSLILPMFGRLPAADQQKIFRPSKLTKIVIATNVAETSITVPGIRYVIDTGLARISQYNVRARTTSLPITRVSQASADQRKGRCGRIGPGICIRLYSEEDYLGREQYTLPEIKRSNLAEVILQMIAMDLGSPLDFPFLEPPHSGAIRDGYALLKELSALDSQNRLSEIGELMARLPIDPPISRILIAARENNCLREIKIIAPALAIQDPRVRPAEHESEADSAHKKFAHPQSDFLTLLNIWNLFHEVQDKVRSWNRLKKFCLSHYLSFQRMREWIDLHDQLASLLDREKGFTENTVPASYQAIHKSLCTGFLRNIGLKKEKKLYQGAGNKELMVFPGSNQFHSSGNWIIAASFLETNRLYALTVANIDPEWLIETGDHLCRRSWSNPRWQKKNGQVVADEKISLFGLILSADRQVNFGRTSPKNREAAREIFIQHGLLQHEIHDNYPFLKKNRDLLEKWQDTEERLRKRDLLVDDTTLHQFYEQRLPFEVYDRFSLNRFLGKKTNHSFLEMKETDILSRKPEEQELQHFPRHLTVGSRRFSLQYHLSPGDDDDGVTVRIPLDIADSVSETCFEWLVPGLLREKVLFLLKGLPKRIRKHLIPLSSTVDLLLDDCTHYQGSLFHGLEKGIFKAFRIKVGRADWPRELPPHLCMRFLLYDQNGRTIAAGRELHKLLQDADQSPTLQMMPNHATSQRLSRWQGKLFKTWDFEGLERRIPLFTADKEVAGSLYPALHEERDRGGVTLSFETDPKKARELNVRGSLFLYQLHFAEPFKNLKKYCHTSLSGPSSLWLTSIIGNRKEAVDTLIHFIMKTLFATDLEQIPEKKIFEERITKVQQCGLYQKGQEICDTVLLLLRKRKEAADHIKRFSELSRQSHSHEPERYKEYANLLEEILPTDFLEKRTFSELEGCDRFFQALMIRIERAHANPAKDRIKARQLEPYLEKREKIATDFSDLPKECGEALSLFQAMINEFRIAIFAPEIKREMQVSEKKLKQQWQRVSASCPGL